MPSRASRRTTSPTSRQATRELGRVAAQAGGRRRQPLRRRAAEEAEKLRDPSHVRNYTEEEWRGFFDRAGLELEEVQIFAYPIELEPWLERTECTGADAERVRELLADRITDGDVVFERIALRGKPLA